MTKLAPYSTTARELFAKQMPALAQHLRGTVPLGGPARFEIEGDNAGAWLVDFDAGTVVADDEKAGQPKVIVRAHEPDFLALVEGRMSVDDGLVTKRLHVAGEAAAIAHLLGALEKVRGG